jgi:hypothetical protein
MGYGMSIHVNPIIPVEAETASGNHLHCAGKYYPIANLLEALLIFRSYLTQSLFIFE